MRDGQSALNLDEVCVKQQRDIYMMAQYINHIRKVNRQLRRQLKQTDNRLETQRQKVISGNVKPAEKLKRDEIYKLADKGFTGYQICKKLNYSKSRVYEILNERKQAVLQPILDKWRI